ncbi:Methyltransferase domain protein [Novymonas esmeraldas]|uniref:Methyltransferase domain protein n=1 Tax=Novymonas esmeraldas TaxID=1808958 RepID=A0AAW0EUN5_9TRYP
MSRPPSPPPCTAEHGAVQLQEHSNANLLKVDTHDVYSTVGAIKKFIAKSLPAPVGEQQQQSPPQPLFHGLLRINKNPKNAHIFMAFATAEDRAAALSVLQRISYRGRPWTEAAVSARDLDVTHKGGVKRRRDGDGDGDGGPLNKLAQYEHLPMAEQLERKKQHCLGVMRSIVPSRVYGHGASQDRFLGLLPSPETRGYRNHVNLSFGLCADGVTPALGFQAGALVEGTAAIQPATLPDSDVVTMHPAAKVVAVALMDVCEEFRDPAKGGIDVFDKVKMRGFWRKVQVRHNVLGEVMMDIEVDTASTTAEVWAAVRQRLVTVLTAEALRARLVAATGRTTAAVTSLQCHTHTGISSMPHDAPREVLHGGATLTEHLAGLRYELSPQAFFQVNTPGMEVMLSKVSEVAELTAGTTLLDLCSGTGTIGLTLAKHVKRVVGIELVESAVANAQRNARLNGITNAEFYCGRVEHLLPTVIHALPLADRGDIVAVLDPPRAGVNGTVLKWIRGTATIRRVVYISCEQKALERDCPGLTKPSTKAYRGCPFEVSAAFAVDLFPHTHHVEMVAVLTRRAEAADADDAPSRDSPPASPAPVVDGGDAETTATPGDDGSCTA